MNTKTVVLLTFFFIAGGVATYAHAEEKDEAVIEDQQKDTDKAAETEEGKNVVVTRIKDKFNVSDETIEKLHQQKMGYGEIDTTLALAQRMEGGITDDNIKKITDLRTGDQHLGWGQIAKKFNVTVGDLKKSAKAIKNDSESSAESSSEDRKEGPRVMNQNKDNDDQEHQHTSSSPKSETQVRMNPASAGHPSVSHARGPH